MSSFVLRLDIVADTPIPRDKMNGTETSPVVAPLPSNAKPTNSSGTKIAMIKINRYRIAKTTLISRSWRIRNKAKPTKMPIPDPMIHKKVVSCTTSNIMCACLAKTDNAGSATVVRRPNKNPKKMI